MHALICNSFHNSLKIDKYEREKKVHIVKTWAGVDGRVLDASWNFLLMNHISSCSVWCGLVY